MSRISTWYSNLNPIKKLLVVFACNLLYWFIAYLLLLLLRAKEDTLSEVVFDAIFMGVFWTLLFNWKNVKAAFKNKKHEQTN